MKEVIASLVSQGLHFTMTGDVWKTAGPVRRTYVAGETPAISEDLLDMEIPRIPKSTPAISTEDLLDMEAPRIPKSTSTISEDMLDMETPRIPKSTPAAISEDNVLDMETPRSPKRLRSSALDESQTM